MSAQHCIHSMLLRSFPYQFPQSGFLFFEKSFSLFYTLVLLISIFVSDISVKRVARTCAIIRVWDYPNKPDLAKVVPIRIGTLLAKFWNRPSGHCLPVTDAIMVPDEIRILLRVCPACQVLKGWQSRTLTAEPVNRFQVY